jgi:hypothetical protein
MINADNLRQHNKQSNYMYRIYGLFRIFVIKKFFSIWLDWILVSDVLKHKGLLTL